MKNLYNLSERNCPILKKCSFKKCFLWLTLQIVAFHRVQYILRPTNTNRRNRLQKKCIHEKNRVFKSAIKQMCLVRSIDIHPTWREAWRASWSVAIVSRNTDIRRLCSQTDSWRKISLPRNISTLEAMLVWTKEKSISLFACWNAQKSLQKKCHRRGGKTRFSFP